MSYIANRVKGYPKKSAVVFQRGILINEMCIGVLPIPKPLTAPFVLPLKHSIKYIIMFVKPYTQLVNPIEV